MPAGKFFKDSFRTSISLNKFVDFYCTAGDKMDIFSRLLIYTITGAYFQNFFF